MMEILSSVACEWYSMGKIEKKRQSIERRMRRLQTERKEVRTRQRYQNMRR